MTDTVTVSPARQQQSWVVLTGLFALANFLEVAVVAHFVLYTPAFLAEIGFSTADINAWTGPIASLAFVVGIWFVPFWGVLADRHGRKPLILRSYYVELPAMVLAALSQNIWLYLVARALTGFALGNTGLMYASLTETAPRRRVALALSLVNGSAPVGSLVGALAGGLIVAAYGVHLLFAIDAVVAGVIAVLLTVGYHESFVPKETPSLKAMLGNSLRTIVQSPVATTVFLISFVYSLAFFFSYAYLPVRVGEIVGEQAAPAAIGVTQGAAGVATLIGSALFGSMAARVGYRKLLAILMALGVFLWLPVYQAQQLIELAGSWAAYNAVSPAITSLLFAILSLNVPADKRGTILSMIYLPMNVAFIVGPFTASLVARNYEVRDVFLVSAGLSAAALLILIASISRMQEKQNVIAE